MIRPMPLRTIGWGLLFAMIGASPAWAGPSATTAKTAWSKILSGTFDRHDLLQVHPTPDRCYGPDGRSQDLSVCHTAESLLSHMEKVNSTYSVQSSGNPQHSPVTDPCALNSTEAAKACAEVSDARTRALSSMNQFLSENKGRFDAAGLSTLHQKSRKNVEKHLKAATGNAERAQARLQDRSDSAE